MGAPNSNDASVPVTNVQNGGGGRLSSAGAAVPSRNPAAGGAKGNVNRSRNRGDEIDSYCGTAMCTLVTLYFFFMFAMLGCYEKWWHSAAVIMVATFFLVLVCLFVYCNEVSITPLAGDFYLAKPLVAVDSAGGDLSTGLIIDDDLEAAAGASKTGPV